MEFEVKAKGFTGSESNIGNHFSAYRILHIYIYSVDMEQVFKIKFNLQISFRQGQIKKNTLPSETVYYTPNMVSTCAVFSLYIVER